MGESLCTWTPPWNGSIRVELNGQRTTSGSGALLLREALDNSGVIEALEDNLVDRRHPLRVVSRRGEGGPRSQTHTLMGNTCMEHDVIESRFEADLQAGDFIIFENRGAYSINYKPDFIHPAPAIVDQLGKVLKSEDTVAISLSAYTARFGVGEQ